MNGFSFNRQNLIPLIVLPLIVLLCLWVYSLPMRDGTPAQAYDSYSENGEWDIRGVDFDTYFVRLHGDVEYVPNQLLTPEEFAASDDIIVGAIPNGTKYLTSRVRVKVEDDRLYGFSRYSPDYGCRIYLNGRLLGNVGVPGTSADTTVPDEKIFKFAAQPENGKIEIVIQASNFIHRDQSSHVGWVIGNAAPGTDWMYESYITTTLIMGFYLLLSLVCLLLFFMLPSYRANLWVSLLSLMWAARTGVIGPKIFLSLIPALSWTAAFRIEYLSIPVTLALLVAAYHQIFPGVMHRWFRIAAYAVSGAFSLLFLLADTIFMSQSLIWMEAAAGAAAIYVLVRLAMKVRKPKIEQRIIILGLFLILAALVNDVLYYNNINFGFGTWMETCVLIFAMFQMTAMILSTMREAAAAKEAEQKAALRADMMAAISHDTRTPLAVLSNYATLIAMEMKAKGADAQTTADLDKIATESQRIAGLLEEMQNISCLKENEAEYIPVDTGEILRHTYELFLPMLERRGVVLTLDVEDALPLALGNPDWITRVVFNLVTNAKDHTESGTIALSAKKGGGFITVKLSDTGCGIDPGLLPNVFEKYVHGETGGTGLGLFICREIVESHGGTISINSEVGKGTAVTFTLPEYKEESGDGK